MKIAMMTNNYKPIIGGVPVSVERLSGELRKRGHQVIIFAPSHPDQTPEEDVVRYRSTNKTLASGFAIPSMFDSKVVKAFKEYDFDLVHVHHPVLIGHTGLALAKHFKIPVVFTYHTRYEEYVHHLKFLATKKEKESSFKKLLTRGVKKTVSKHNRVFTNLCDTVFAPTPLIKEHLLDSGTKANIEILSTGLGQEDFDCNEEYSKEIRERYLGNKERLFCCVARLEDEKNLKFLIRAIALYRNHVTNNFRLLIMGDGSQRQALEDYSRMMGMEANILFLGNIPRNEISSYYNACDLFVFSSLSETQGIVLLEAMAAGLPVVAVHASGVCDVVRDNVNGFETPEDEHSFMKQVQQVFEVPGLYSQLSVGAKSTAKGETAAKMAMLAETEYLKLVGTSLCHTASYKAIV